MTVNIWSGNIIRIDSVYFDFIYIFFFISNFTADVFFPATVNTNLGAFRDLTASYDRRKLQSADCNVHSARAAPSQLLTMSGKRLLDVWILKASSGRAPNWQHPRSLKAARPTAKENTTGAKPKLSETRRLKEVGALSQWPGSAAQRQVK